MKGGLLLSTAVVVVTALSAVVVDATARLGEGEEQRQRVLQSNNVRTIHIHAIYVV